MRLKEIRIQEKKDVKEVATFLGISEQAYYKYENLKNQPSLENLKKLADYYDVTLDYLVGRTYNDELGYLEKSDKETIKLFLNLSESDKDKVTGYIQALIQK